MTEARWRQHQTDAERARIAEIDRQIDQVAILKAERSMIANRAAQRARYAARAKP